MTLYEILLFVHIVAAMFWIGGGLMLQVVSGRIARSSDLDLRRGFAREASAAGNVVGIAAMVVLAAGIWMVLADERWAFSMTWIWVSLVLFAVSGAIGAAYFGRTGKRIAEAYASGETGVPEADRLTRQMTNVSRIDLLILLVVVWLMVAKPGA